MKKSDVSFVLCDGILDLYIANDSFTIDESHVNFKTVVDELLGQRRPAILRKLVNVRKAVERFMKGRVKVDLNTEKILYKGTSVEPFITKKIVEFLQLGLDAKPLIKFLDKLMSNPSARAVNELYKFLENNGLCLAPDGDVYSYKSVRTDWYDHYSGTILNKVGKIIKIPRNTVDDNCNNTCSVGIHCGTFNYAKTFHHGNQRIVLVKINPRDVVSIPIDGSNKCRVCKYKVIREYTCDEPIKDAVYLNEEV